MREAMATWLRVLGVLAMVCSVFAAEEGKSAVEDFVAVVSHQQFPRAAHLGVTVVPEESRIGHGVAFEHLGGDVEESKLGFDQSNASQGLGAWRAARGSNVFGKPAEIGSWQGNVFEQGRQWQHNRHWYRHHAAKHLHGRDNETWFGRLRASFGWGLPRKIGDIFSAISSFLSDVPSTIKTWSAGGGRKQLTLESVSEPLEIHASLKIYSPSTVCNLREKLSHIFAIIAEVVVATTGSFEKDVLNRNLRMFTGDKMECKIARFCRSITSPCEQEFCDVFLGHHRSGILLAFRILGFNPIWAAINPEGVDGFGVTPKLQTQSLLSENELQVIAYLKKTRRLSNIVFQQVRAAHPTEEIASDSTHWMKRSSKFSGGELISCQVCLRQNIVQLEKLTQKTMLEVCGNPYDSHLERACNYAQANRFVYWTILAYNFRLWERAADVCRNQRACDSSVFSHVDPPGLDPNTLAKGEEVHKFLRSHHYANSFQNPRGLNNLPSMSGSMQWEDQKVRKGTIYRTTMRKRRFFPFEWKSIDVKSVHSGNRLSSLMSFLTRSRTGPIHGLNSRSLPVFSHGTTNREGSETQTSEHKITGSPELRLLRGSSKRPLIDSSPIRVDTVIDDLVVNHHSNLNVISSATEGSRHPDM